MAINTSVLIVGGGLNGLSTALFLAHRNVNCMLVERNENTSIQYKFRGISPRSMEIYRGVGIEDVIREHRTGDQKSGNVVRARNLADPEVNLGKPAWPDTSEISPTTAATCDQDQFEPLLKAYAERFGADVRFNTELMDFDQDNQGIRARIRNLATQTEEEVNASYLIVADGVHSTLRPKLGIERHGPGVLQHWMCIIFETDMKPVLKGQSFTSAMLSDINGSFVPREDTGRWLMSIQYFPDRGERPEDFDEKHCIELIRKGAGRSDIEPRIVDTRHWAAAAYVADRYTVNRAFLVGDAAHVMPPTGGFGGNTGIHDAHNIAWKLEAVLKGIAGPRLLETYESERLPVAERTMAQSLARLQAWFKDPSKKLPPTEPIVEDNAVVFGYLYHSGALIPEEGIATDKAFENPHTPSGRPGSRAAHLLVERQGERLSTIDICNGQWVLLAGPSGGSWLEAAGRSNLASALGLQTFQIGSAEGNLRDIENRWTSAYGIDSAGTVLIRPDGFIAWRARTAVEQPLTILQDVFKRLTFQD